MSSCDPFSLDIIESNLRFISQEMFTVMKRASVSPIIYEVLDMGVALTDARGNLITSGAGLPSFIGMLNKGVRFVLKKYGQDIQPGDIFVSNSPYHGGVTHLNDILFAKPIFINGKLMAWAINMGHWPDIGGMVAGGMSVDATEIYQEGVVLPAIKLFAAGKMEQGIFDIFKANSRSPQSVEGDLWGAVSAVQLGQKRFEDLGAKYGTDMLESAMQDILGKGRKEVTTALKTLPKGAFCAEVTLNNGVSFPLFCTVSDNTFSVDLSDAPKQNASPYNVGRDGVYSAAQIVFKALVSPHTPANEGNYEAIKIITKEGTIFHPKLPMPQGLNFENRMAYFDALLNIAVQIAPDKFSAGHFASICGTFITGKHGLTERHISLVEPQIGGWGACSNEDGASAMFSASHGDTYICPVEVSEARYGISIESLRLSPCQLGQGRHRGGLGIEMTYRAYSDGLELAVAFSKSKNRTWGYEGGQNGSNNYVVVKRCSGSDEWYDFASGVKINKNDKIVINTANGGGYGCTEQRDESKVLHDLKNGYITSETAEKIYGITGSET